MPYVLLRAACAKGCNLQVAERKRRLRLNIIFMKHKIRESLNKNKWLCVNLTQLLEFIDTLFYFRNLIEYIAFW